MGSLCIEKEEAVGGTKFPLNTKAGVDFCVDFLGVEFGLRC
jgi:hypothetical protein